MGEAERVKGIEPSCQAWKACALPLSYTRQETARPPLWLFLLICCAAPLCCQTFAKKKTLRRKTTCTRTYRIRPVEGAGFEPAKAQPPDLQSGPFGSGTPPAIWIVSA